MKKRAFMILLSAAALLCGCTAQTAAPAPTAAQGPTPTTTPAVQEMPAAAAPSEEVQPEQPDAIAETIAGMTLREKIGQMFMIRPDSLDVSQTQDQINDAHSEGVTELSEEMRAVLADYPVGGVVQFGKNITDGGQLLRFNTDLYSATAIPMLLGVDEEGGLIARLANHPAFELPQYESMAAIGATGDVAQAQEMGKTIGGYLKEYGFNLDFAPDADVNSNPDNPVIGTRAFSDDPQVAAEMVVGAVQGFHEAGIACTIKHFPGHGDTATDTHYGYAETQKTKDEIMNFELAPFRAGIDAGADFVMAAHITAPNAAQDGLPASLSHTMLTDWLRGDLDYDGLIITDSLAMEAITDVYSAGDAARMAVEAGVDVLLMPNGLQEAFDALVADVENGTIAQSRIDESVTRILTLKQSYGMLG